MIGSVEKTWAALRGFAHGFLVLSSAEGYILTNGTPLNLSEKDSTGWGIWAVAKDGTKSLTTESLP